MTVGERSDSSKPTSCQTQAMPYLYYCTILHSSKVATSNEFYGDASMCSAHFLPFYEKAVGSKRMAWALWHISAFSNLSTQCFTHFILHLPGIRSQAHCTVGSSAESNSCQTFFVQFRFARAFLPRVGN